MKKTVIACAFAAVSLCAAGSLEAKTTSHKAAKAPAVKVHNTSVSGAYLQCVTFARQFTGMQIFGDAWTWWEKATGKYEEGHSPKPGAVLVFRSQGRMKLGHVAVVSQIITDRYIQVTHANWSPINGRRGQVEDHVNVMDVSEKGDWSKVKVWYGPLNDLGTTIYTTYGFIYQDGKAPAPIAQPEITPMTQHPVQIADATPVQTNSELPADLKAALSPGNNGFLGTNNTHAVTVAAKVTGKPAAELVAQIDADHPEAAAKPEKPHVEKASAEKATAKAHDAKAESAPKVRVHTRHRH